MRPALPALLLGLLLLCGCHGPAPEPQTPASDPPPAEADVREVPIRIIEPVDIQVLPPPDWRGSEPQEGPAITPQPGDTAHTWDPDRAADFPPDAQCSPSELLQKWLTVEGLTEQDLEDRDCRQLVLAVAAGDRSASTVTWCYERSADGWQPVEAFGPMQGFTGSGGMAHDRRRGSRQSPAGLWPLGSAFGLSEKPEDLKLPWRSITPQSYWVGDRHSPLFNTWQERTASSDWSTGSSEHLASFTETYTYACVIGYNTPPYTVPERGFAIFFHVSDHPTTGCMALEEDDFLQVLTWLNPHRNPHILITGVES